VQRVHRRAGQLLVLGDGRALGHVPDIQQMVRHAVAFGLGELGRADVHPAVELHRVGVDHLAAELVRERDAEIRFAGRGRADHGDHQGGCHGRSRGAITRVILPPRASCVKPANRT
jgi:hypothetical protein